MENELTKVLENTQISTEAIKTKDFQSTKDDNSSDSETLTQSEYHEVITENQGNIKLEDDKEERIKIIKELEHLHENQEDDLSKTISHFKKLQSQWKELGNENNDSQTQEIIKHYNLVQDKFYELSKINRELIEYDHKKNFELKTKLCQAAKELLSIEDNTKAFKSLQNLHKEWKGIGPVAKEKSEELWNDFKETSDLIHNKYTAEINANKERNEEISTAKINWCLEIETIDTSLLTTHKEWENKANRIKEINKLFVIDNTSENRINQQLYKRLRTACDIFFEQKAKFYAEKKDEMQINLEKKIALLALAEELKESTDWKNTSNKIIQLQKEWKTIGPTNHKNSQPTWERFIAACDYFFEQKNKQFSTKKDEEKNNLQLKKDVIEKIEKYQLTDNETENIENIKVFYKEFNEIGHVPFKEKDKIYNQFKDSVDKIYNDIRVKFHIANRNYGNNRQKLQRKAEQLRSEIATCENNKGFFSSSKTNNSLEKELDRKINNLRVELEIVIDQLNKLEN